jgi:hypothetical protein
LQWSQALDYERYADEWIMTATSRPADRFYREIELNSFLPDNNNNSDDNTTTKNANPLAENSSLAQLPTMNLGSSLTSDQQHALYLQQQQQLLLQQYYQQNQQQNNTNTNTSSSMSMSTKNPLTSDSNLSSPSQTFS